METLRLKADQDGIAQAAVLLRAGECVAMPTETVYGLAADATNAEAVARVYQAKGRPSFNPLIVHLPSVEAAQAVARFDAEAERLAAAFWPGALTMVLPLHPRAGIAGIVTAGLDSVALRVPAHPVARALLLAADRPLAAPSANPSGRISPTTADHVIDERTGLGGRIAAVLDAGPCAVGVESTIVGWQDGSATLLRPGGIPAESIEDALGAPLARPATNAPLTSPGQLASHYAPEASLRLNATEALPGETLLTFGRAGDFSLSESGDLVEAAARLFDILHKADRTGRPIAVQPIPDHGLGRAINDRLRRAAAPR
ncbi:threonylcarbamoyl-AMP synthase (plasmid) [Paracoccus sp. TK19116]|uniref:Threonylcarbamoyl-AMP synthase n=1 Tax=Paracoccus albicereus TaxID=2922394 RepID=A0ABT1ML39_9RHOB|nr:L-threonylcarbamoyladenylate synthase [Paracoccus albicereus]MCQ0969010.1 threonylcarbamoyl-AMP synthase [Paracoccus albicereus]